MPCSLGPRFKSLPGNSDDDKRRVNSCHKDIIETKTKKHEIIYKKSLQKEKS
jgi:hypothetical protein